MEIEMSRVSFLSRTAVRRAIRIGAAVVLAMVIVVPAARAQQPVPPAQPAPPTLQLSMSQAVTMSLETNLGLKSDRLNVSIAAEDVAGARAAFRPQLRSS